MEGAEQVEALAQAGKREAAMAATYLFNAARASQVLAGCQRVIDLGCGPGVQLGMLAEANPDIHFVGVDLSADMLAAAQDYLDERGLKNVVLIQADITQLSSFPTDSFDGVFSSLALHQLPTKEELLNCFREIGRVLTPEGALFVSDLCRLRSLTSVEFFVERERPRQSPHLVDDFRNSLLAAFSLKEFETAKQSQFDARVQVIATLGIRLFIVLETAPRPLPEKQRILFQEMASQMAVQSRRDLDDLRRFLRWGGLSLDPFLE
jgi:ubiquinone/menaquinone biosynthesis C-methylase UbiE